MKADSADRHAVRVIINPSAETDWNNANFEMSFRNGAAGVPVITARYWNNDGTGANTLQDTLAATTAHVGKWRHVILERSKSAGVRSWSSRTRMTLMMFKKTIDAVKPPSDGRCTVCVSDGRGSTATTITMSVRTAEASTT